MLWKGRWIHGVAIVVGTTFLECPVRVKEVEVARIWAVHQVSYAEAAQIAEGRNGTGCPAACSKCCLSFEGS